jgi:8-oxo-dGTP diphosphatase
VDTVIFDEILDENRKFILIKRKNNPFKNYWAIPGGFVEYGETVENAAIREAKEETGVDIELKKLFNIYSNADRDPRGHTITIVYIATGNINDMKSGSDAEDILLCSFEELTSLKIAFDHEKILTDILENFSKNKYFYN